MRAGAGNFYSRYILCELVDASGTAVSHQWKDHEVYVTVRNALHTAHGDFGAALVKKSLNVKYLNSSTGVVVIRVRRGCQDLVLTTLPFIKSIRGTQASFRTLHLSGTIRSCQKFLIRYHTQQLQKLLSHCTDPDLRKNIVESLKNVTQVCQEDTAQKEVTEELYED